MKIIKTIETEVTLIVAYGYPDRNSYIISKHLIIHQYIPYNIIILDYIKISIMIKVHIVINIFLIIIDYFNVK